MRLSIPETCNISFKRRGENSNMEYYSRSANSKGEKETVSHHNLKVSSYAESNASHFGKTYEGKIVGKYHDFGKYGLFFQKVLKHEESKINHEIAGSLLVKQLYKSASIELQIVIASHHKGLNFHDYDIIKFDRYFDENFMDSYGRRMSLSSPEEFNRAINIFKEEIGFDNKPIKRSDYTCCKNPIIEQMLYIRMLLSALVDADYTASAEHFEANFSEISTGSSLDAKVYLKNLFNFRNEIKKSSKAHSEINSIRDKVFEDCLSAAEEAPGFFTLTAPTGTGKTLSLLAFALLHAQKWNKRRIIIVLPFLSIIEQNAAQYSTICPSLLEDHSQSIFDEATRLYSERWSTDVIVTTSVKFFEGLFRDKPTDCRRLHSISDSVIVFDEAQSLPHTLVGSTIETMNALCHNYNCTVLFSTATQPAFDFRQDLNWNTREIIRDIASLFETTKRVKVDWRLSQTTSFESIAEDMSQSKSCCVIVNMKKHSVELFTVLQDKLPDEKDSLFHISTDMCVAHRKKVLEQVDYRLKHGLSCRLVSTQCIEAGVDLDFDKIYRALAPLDAIVQSAGRCNRNGRLEYGEVVVFIPDEERYPDDYYQNAANKVKYLADKHDIDISNPEHMKEYYYYLYSEFKSDKPKLVEAINKLDFAEVSKQYKLISNGGNNVIVPYANEQVLFDEISTLARENGLTPEIIKKARPISVTVYGDKIEEVAERLYFKSTKRSHSNEKSNWFILLDSELYSHNTGLQLEETASLNTIF